MDTNMGLSDQIDAMLEELRDAVKKDASRADYAAIYHKYQWICKSSQRQGRTSYIKKPHDIHINYKFFTELQPDKYRDPTDQSTKG